jgi:hypothetical protein
VTGVIVAPPKIDPPLEVPVDPKIELEVVTLTDAAVVGTAEEADEPKKDFALDGCSGLLTKPPRTDDDATVVVGVEVAPTLLRAVKGEPSFLVPEPKIEPVAVVDVPKMDEEIGVVLLSLDGVPKIDPLLMGCPPPPIVEAPPNGVDVVGFVAVVATCSGFEDLFSIMVVGVGAGFDTSTSF